MSDEDKIKLGSAIDFEWTVFEIFIRMRVFFF